MNSRAQYNPGPARDAHIEKSDDLWTLVLVRELRHAPQKVWQALTDPAHLREWAPFDADGKLDAVGTKVKLTWVGTARVTEATVTRADPPRVLEFQDLRWELEPRGSGSRLTLWHSIDRRFITWGAAGWHICIDVLDRQLAGDPIGRLVGADSMNFGGWQRLTTEYAQHFGIEAREWPAKTTQKS